MFDEWTETTETDFEKALTLHISMEKELIHEHRIECALRKIISQPFYDGPQLSRKELNDVARQIMQ